MSFRDELNAASKTKVESQKESYEYGMLLASNHIYKIQDNLMNKVKRGEYQELPNGKKYVQTEYYGIRSGQLLSDMGMEGKVEEYKINTGLFSRERGLLAKYIIKDQDRYDGFMKGISDFALEENADVKIVCRCDHKGEWYDFDPIVGTKIKDNSLIGWHFSICVICGVTY